MRDSARSPEDIARALGEDYRVLPEVPANARGFGFQSKAHAIEHVPTGAAVVVSFGRDGRLGNSTPLRLQPSAFRTSSRFQLVRTIHEQVILWGAAVWLGLFLAAGLPAARRRRMHFGLLQASLAVALLCLSAAWVSASYPYRTIGYGTLSVRAPRYSTEGVMALLSIAALAWAVAISITRRRRRNNPHDLRCYGCNYELRANASGICPEFGTRMPPHLRRKVRRGLFAVK